MSRSGFCEEGKKTQTQILGIYWPQLYLANMNQETMKIKQWAKNFICQAAVLTNLTSGNCAFRLNLSSLMCLNYH